MPSHCLEAWGEIAPECPIQMYDKACYDKARGRLLQLTSSDLLLVCGVADGVGSSKPHRNLLAPSPCAVGGCVPFRHGNRLPSQLA